MNNLQKVGSILLGITIFIAVIAAVSLLFAFGVKIAFVIQPTISWFAGLLFLIDVIVLAFAVLPSIRGGVGLLLFISSYIFGLSAWIYGLAATLSLWGVFALIIGIALGGFGVVPIGMFAALFTRNWSILLTLLFAVVLTYGTRFIGALLMDAAETSPQKQEQAKKIIDLTEDATVKRTWEDIE